MVQAEVRASLREGEGIKILSRVPKVALAVVKVVDVEEARTARALL